MRRNRGFTLIELLVVVAILALLIAILVPSLSGARERAKAAVCGSNMRQIGQLIHVYAGRAENRAPGMGWNTASLSWADLINYDLLDQLTRASGSYFNNSVTLYGIQELQKKKDYQGFMANKRFVVCPNFVPAGDYTRCYALNMDANGGGDINPNPDPTVINALGKPGGFPGSYGKSGQPEMYSNNPGFFKTYSLGADLRRFHSNQFLVVETERASDVTVFGPAQTGDGSVSLGVAPSPYTNTPYAGGSTAQTSFRHPYFKKGNFLLMDGHVEALSPKDDVNSELRLTIPESWKKH